MATWIYGTEEGDLLRGGNGVDVLFGFGGNDVLWGGGGADILNGGGGVDWADYSDKTTAVSVTLNGATYVTVTVGGIAEDTIRDIENVQGGAADDVLVGDRAQNWLKGLGGNDLLRGGDGMDVLDGGDGSSDWADYSDKITAVSVTLNGTANATVTVNGFAEDTIRNIENVIGGRIYDTLVGDNQANELHGLGGDDVLQGRGGADVLDGGDGTGDWAIYSETEAGVSVVLAGASNAVVLVGGSAPDLIRNIENVQGGSGNDMLVGDGQANALFGLAGNDELRGGGGADLLDGGAGTGDWASYADKATAVTVTLDGSLEVIVTAGGVSEDTIRNIENVKGGSADDVLRGDDKANELRGLGGNDTLAGGTGNDLLLGGVGADRFVFDSALDPATNLDRLGDFDVAADTIVLENAIFTAIAGTGGLTAAQFTANVAGAAQDAGDRIVYETDTGNLFYDSDGSGAVGSVLFAQLAPGLAPTHADFLIV